MFYLKNLLKYFFVLIIILSISLFVLIEQNKKLKNKILFISFLDVGQGDSIFIQAPNGKQILIDGGAGTHVARSLSKVMPFFDREIDLLITTHYDADHVEGFLEIFERYKVKEYADNGFMDDSALSNKVREAIEKENLISQFSLKSGNEIILDQKNDVRLKVLWPAYEYENKDKNELSVVIQLIYGEHKFLLTGDASKEIEEKLIYKFDLGLKSNILKAGHHGSKTSTSLNFLSKTEPEYVVISAGKDNRYGHPHSEVLENINSFGLKILETAMMGSINFQSDGATLELK